MSERTQRLTRRNFLLAAGATAATAATAAVLAARGTSPGPSVEKDKRATRGYHATGHVNDYYRTAKL